MSANFNDSEIDLCFQGIRNRDERALTRIFSIMSRRIFDFAMGYVGNAATAEEVVTETFFEVWKSAGTFCGDSKVTTWIYGVARHKALDKVRSSQRRNRHEQGWDDYVENMPSHEATAFDGVAARQSGETISRALAVLSEEQRECILLVFYQEMSLQEVADIQGVPCNTVKTRLFHARKKLRAHLERDERQTAFSERNAGEKLATTKRESNKVRAISSRVSYE